MDISPLLLELLLRDAAELGAISTLVKLGRLKPYLNKSEAFKRYGRNNVEHWIERGLVTKRKDGDHSASWRLERIELEIVSKSVTLLKYDSHL